MAKGMEDKLFFLNEPPKNYEYTFVDFGCADGTLINYLVSIKNKTYNNLVFNHNKSVQDIIDSVENKITISKVLYWFIWLLITGGLIFGFYYLENNWLEDNK